MNRTRTFTLILLCIFLCLGPVQAEEEEIKRIVVDKITLINTDAVRVLNKVILVNGDVRYKRFKVTKIKPEGVVKLEYDSLYRSWYASIEPNTPDTDVTVSWSYKGHTTTSKILVREGKEIKAIKAFTDFTLTRRDGKVAIGNTIVYTNGYEDDSKIFELLKVEPKSIVKLAKNNLKNVWEVQRMPFVPDTVVTVYWGYKGHETTSKIKVIEEIEIKSIRVEDVTVSRDKVVRIIPYVTFIDGYEEQKFAFDLDDLKPKGSIRMEKGVGIIKPSWYVWKEPGAPDEDVTVFWSYKKHKTTSKVFVRGEEIKSLKADTITLVENDVRKRIRNLITYSDNHEEVSSEPFQLVKVEPEDVVQLVRGDKPDDKHLWFATKYSGVFDTDVTLYWSYKEHQAISEIFIRGEPIKFDARDLFGRKKITRQDLYRNYLPWALVTFSGGERSYCFGDDKPELKMRFLENEDKIIIKKDDSNCKYFERRSNVTDGNLKVEFSYNDVITLKKSAEIPIQGQINTILVEPRNKILIPKRTTTLDYEAVYSDGTEDLGLMTSKHHPKLEKMDPANALKLNKPSSGPWYLSVNPQSPAGPVKLKWQLIDGVKKTYTTEVIIKNNPIVGRMDIGSLPTGYCSHVDLYIDVALHFNQSMKKSVIPTIELEWAKDQWKKVEIKDPKWSNAVVNLKDSRFDCKIKIPRVEEQKIFRPRFRVTKAEGLNNTGVMSPHIQEKILPYLTLKFPTKNWIVLSKNIYKPGERVIGRFNRALKEGTVFFAVYKRGAADKDHEGFLYAPDCSWITWSTNSIPGKYEYRLVQQIKKNNKVIYKRLASTEFEVKK